MKVHHLLSGYECGHITYTGLNRILQLICQSRCVALIFILINISVRGLYYKTIEKPGNKAMSLIPGFLLVPVWRAQIY